MIVRWQQGDTSLKRFINSPDTRGEFRRQADRFLNRNSYPSTGPDDFSWFMGPRLDRFAGNR